MINILRYEVKKTILSKAAYICLGLTVLLSIITAASYVDLSKQAGSLALQEELVTAIPSTGFDLILTVLIPILVCEEFASGTAKLIIGRGYKRVQLYFAKYAVAIFSTAILTISCILTNIITSYILGVTSCKLDIHVVKIIMLQFLVMLVDSTLSFMLSMLIQKKSAAIATSITAPFIIAIIMTAADSLIKGVNISKYWVASFITKLSDINVESKVCQIILICGIIYIIIFLLLGQLYIRKKDL